MRIAVVPTTDIERRVSSALASHPLVEEVGLVGKKPPSSWKHRMSQIETVDGYDLVVGRDAVPAARRLGIPSVGGAQSTITGADLPGLAMALAAGTGFRPYATVEGDVVKDGELVGYPVPLGWLRVSQNIDGVGLTPTSGDLAGVVAENGSTSIGVVDDRRFLETVALAAGALLGPAHQGPVWSDAARYVSLCESLGLVIARTGT